jgi:hypothetical protein
MVEAVLPTPGTPEISEVANEVHRTLELMRLRIQSWMKVCITCFSSSLPTISSGM